jgi:hypothetical protein
MKQILDNLLRLQNLELGTERVSMGSAEEVRKNIPVHLLGQYDRLRARGKKGVAMVRNGVCSQCHMALAVGLLASLHRDDSVYRCATCGAYLYLVSEPPVLEIAPRINKPARRGRPRKDAAHAA